MASAHPTRIASYVFLDLEATGLAGIGEKPRITELSLVAVGRESLLESCSNHTPRVLNKLTLCVDPQKAVGPQASGITGLYNDALSMQLPFTENVADLCSLFFAQLVGPVCLLAHAGTKYDFPLLAAELQRIGRSFPDGLLCADTLDAYRTILGIPGVQSRVIVPPPPPVKRAPASPQPGPSGWRPPQSATRRQHLPARNGLCDTTPELQTVKSHTANVANAPEKRKPALVEEPTKAVRVSTARRRLEFGPSSSELAKNAVDDVDREDVMDGLVGFRLTPRGVQVQKDISVKSPHTKDGDDDCIPHTPTSTADITTGTDNVSHSNIELKSQQVTEGTLPFDPISNFTEGSQGCCEHFGLWEELTSYDDLPDDMLLEAVAEVEASEDIGAVSSDVKGRSSSGQHQSIVSVDEPQPSCSTARETDAAGTITGYSEEEPPPPPPPSSEGDNQKTPTSGGAKHLDSFPTPSPSPHKNGDHDDTGGRSLPLGSGCASPYSPPPGLQFYSSPGSPYSPGDRPVPSPITSNVLGFSLALGPLHKRLLGYEPPESHSAEGDCMSLLRLSHKLVPWFCDWVDDNATAFADVPPLYKATKRPKKP